MKRWQIRGSAAIFLLLLMVAAGCVIAPVYYLNDDVTMRSILSGACTGNPDGHAVYMKYPLTWLLAGLYRLTDGLGIFIPWFDLFLAGCILLAGMGILSGCWELFRGKILRMRMAGILISALLFVGLLLPQYLYIHYTIVAALLAGGAVFLWEVGEDRKFPVFLLGLCYLVRDKVFFLALPFLLVAALDVLLRDIAGSVCGGMSGEETQDTGRRGKLRESVRRQGLSLLALMFMIAAFWGIDFAAYGDSAWQSYREYNDSRTKLYDYTDFLSTDRYGENPELLGLDWEQYQVLSHYDTILDPSIDVQVLNRTVERIDELKEGEASEYLKQCLKAYYLHIRYDGSPYSLIWAGCYGILLVLLAVRRKWSGLLTTAALALGRSLIWIYLIVRGRFPERIWISLYMMEICLLLGMILREVTESKRADESGRERWLPITALVLCLALTGSVIPTQLGSTAQRAARQQEKQDQWNLLADSLDERYLYLIDVYSAVAFAGEVYGRDDGHIMLLGGWLAQSPLVQQRLAAYDAEDGAMALRHEQVRLIVEGGRDVSWMEEYLRQRMGAVELQVQETVLCGENLEFVVYRLAEQGNVSTGGD